MAPEEEPVPLARAGEELWLLRRVVRAEAPGLDGGGGARDGAVHGAGEAAPKMLNGGSVTRCTRSIASSADDAKPLATSACAAATRYMQYSHCVKPPRAACSDLLRRACSMSSSVAVCLIAKVQKGQGVIGHCDSMDAVGTATPALQGTDRSEHLEQLHRQNNEAETRMDELHKEVSHRHRQQCHTPTADWRRGQRKNRIDTASARKTKHEALRFE